MLLKGGGGGGVAFTVLCCALLLCVLGLVFALAFVRCVVLCGAVLCCVVLYCCAVLCYAEHSPSPHDAYGAPSGNRRTIRCADLDPCLSSAPGRRRCGRRVRAGVVPAPVGSNVWEQDDVHGSGEGCNLLARERKNARVREIVCAGTVRAAMEGKENGR